jgi:hypothetical protein
MSEYRWYVKKAWIGVMKQVLAEEITSMEVYNHELVGVIRRSGWVSAMGHFCYLRVNYKGKNRDASGAEDRIYPFHSLVLDVGEEPGELELIYLGWCRDHSTPAFRDKYGRIVEIIGAGKEKVNTSPIPTKLWQPGWKEASLNKKVGGHTMMR